MHLTDEQQSAFVDGALAPAELRAAREHLAACEDCTADVAMLEALQARLAGATIEPSTEFEARTLAKLRAMPMPRAPWWRFVALPTFRIAAAAVALITLAVAGAYEAGYVHTGRQVAVHSVAAPGPSVAMPASALASAEDAAIADQAEFLEQLDMLEDLDVLEAMDRVPG